MEAPTKLLSTCVKSSFLCLGLDVLYPCIVGEIDNSLVVLSAYCESPKDNPPFLLSIYDYTYCSIVFFCKMMCYCLLFLALRAAKLFDN